MKKNKLIFGIILFLFLVLSAGCNGRNNHVATISATPESDYVATFDKLNLGNLFDFEIKLPKGENKWITLWVDSYIDGIKDPEPLIRLSFSSTPDEKIQDHLGFAMMSLNAEETYAYVSLYGPNVSGRREVDHLLREDIFNTLEYAISDKAVGIELGEEKLLAVYRETKGSAVHSLNFDDEQVIEKAIEENDLVYLLKIMIEEEHSSK